MKKFIFTLFILTTFLGLFPKAFADSDPVVETTTLSSFTDSAAILTGKIKSKYTSSNGQYRPTNYYFEYGKTNPYENGPTESQEITTNALTDVTKAITGLTPDTIYHYRIATEGSTGPIYGAVQSFQTKAKSTPITPVQGIAFQEDYNLLAPIGNLDKIDKNANVGDYLNILFKIIIGLCGVLAVVMIVIGGIQYMGEDSVFSKTEAKSRITNAIFGLLLALGAFALLNTINPDLLGGKGVNIAQQKITISSEDTSTGSSTSLCVTSSPPDPNSATGTTLVLNNTMNTKYLPAIPSNIPTGIKLLITSQAVFEGFSDTPSPGTKSYRTNNPGNIGNTDDGTTKSYPTLAEGIAAQNKIATNVANGNSKSYKVGGDYPCALGETYNAYLYQYLRIYATGARTSNAYLNAIVGYFKSKGKTITGKTTMSEIANIQ